MWSWRSQSSGYSAVPLQPFEGAAEQRSGASSARSSSSSARAIEVHELKRRINIPFNVFGLAVVAPMEDAFGVAHNSLIMCLTMATTFIQFMMIYYMHEVTLGLVSNSSSDKGVCHTCSRLLQFLATFCYVMIIWDEIAITLDLLEIIWQAENKEHLVDAADEWTIAHEHRCLCCDMGWHFMSNERVIYQRQFDGFDMSAVPFRWKIVLVFYAIVPKLIIEMGLMYAGSQYIIISENNEAVITSVCAVNFIISLDEMALNAFMPVRYKRAMRVTLFSYEAHSRLARLISHVRTDWRPFLDPLICTSLAYALFQYTLGVAGCSDALDARLW